MRKPLSDLGPALFHVHTTNTRALQSFSAPGVQFADGNRPLQARPGVVLTQIAAPPCSTEIPGTQDRHTHWLRVRTEQDKVECGNTPPSEKVNVKRRVLKKLLLPGKCNNDHLDMALKASPRSQPS